VQQAISESRAIPRTRYEQAQQRRAELRRSLARYMQDVPVLLTAVSSLPAFPAGETSHQVGAVTLPRMALVAPCRAIALFGLPSVSVPVLRTVNGAYVSVQVVGRGWAEHEVLAVAALLQRECPLP
jgi:amidase